MTDHLARLTAALADRYAIERELGQGGMATVYLARDLKHDRRVALKVLRPELAGSLGPDRFLREITTTAQLTHPHILPLLDSGQASLMADGGRLTAEFRLLDEARGMARDPGTSGEFWGGFGAWQPYQAALEFRAHGHPQAYRRAIEQALELARAAPASDTARFGPRNGLAMVLYAAERWEEARAVYAELYRGDTTNIEFLGGLGVSEARLGRRAEAERLAGSLARTNPPWSAGRSPYWRARIAAVLGNRDGAVTALREAIAQGIGCAVHISNGTMEDCHREIDFESLRGYAPFVELLRPKG